MSSDLVVVTYKKDLDLCDLFFRSVEQFIKPGLFKNFWVIITDDSEIDIKSKFNWNVVRLKNLNNTYSNIGYADQQQAKLDISKLITSDWYWVFDSKNFFIRSITNSDLYDNNCARVNVTRPTDYWKQSWINSLQYFNLPYVDPIHNRTPYPIKTSIAQTITCDFKSLWHNHMICEFFLYNAWVLKHHSFEDMYYSDTRIFNTTIWPIDLSMEIYKPKNLKFLLDKHLISNMPVWSTGLHRTTIDAMDSYHQQEWSEFLVYLKLFDSNNEVYSWYDKVRLAAQEK